MKVNIEPLSGKYYGTIIKYRSDLRPYDGVISIWDMGDFTPSDRQLKYWNCNIEEAEDDDMMCDQHYETKESYRLAEIIAKALKSA